jgi:alpha-glucosidase
LQSRSSRENAKRDWYLWRDRPNNWMSNFGGSGWEWDEPTGQFYYHSFLKEQPDLNWRNQAVRAAMYDVLRFWLDKGVDGFRVDVMWLMIKDDQYRDNPPNPQYEPGQSSDHSFLPVYNANRPEVHAVVAEMRSVIDGYPNRVLIGEIYLPTTELMAYYGPNLDGADLPFNFLLLQAPWTAQAVAGVITDYTNALPRGAWPNWVLGNHDKPRVASRVGAGQARVAAMLLLTLPGTVTLYYGEEIGMTDGTISAAEVRDPAEKRQPGIGMGRDPERTPMPWDESPLAGFTTGSPWLPLNSDHAIHNVEALQKEDGSILQLYHKLIALRRAHSVFTSSQIHSVIFQGDLLCYERRSGPVRFRVVLNLGHSPMRAATEAGTILLNTSLNRMGEQVRDSVLLEGSEGLLIRLNL